MTASRMTSSRSEDIRRNGIFVSILICTASGRRFGRPSGSGCGSISAVSPPWIPGFADPLGIHWDYDPWNAEMRMFQGVVALTDIAANQGGFRCVPSLYQGRNTWLRAPKVDHQSAKNWLADNTEGREIRECVGADR
jgi:hypothetical protein